MLAKDDLQQRWWDLEARLVERFGKKPDMETILFLIGIQEFGDIKEKFTKEQKQDLMHVAVCSLLSQSGYYELEAVDDATVAQAGAQLCLRQLRQRHPRADSSRPNPTSCSTAKDNALASSELLVTDMSAATLSNSCSKDKH